jgi:hypothetical protein
MPRTPVSRLVRFTLADGTSVIFDHLGYRRPTVHPRARESRSSRWLPATPSTSPNRPPAPHLRRCRALPSSAAGRPSRRLWVWPLCAGARRDYAPGLCDRQRLAMSDQGDQVTGAHADVHRGPLIGLRRVAPCNGALWHRTAPAAQRRAGRHTHPRADRTQVRAHLSEEKRRAEVEAWGRAELADLYE